MWMLIQFSIWSQNCIFSTSGISVNLKLTWRLHLGLPADRSLLLCKYLLLWKMNIISVYWKECYDSVIDLYWFKHKDHTYNILKITIPVIYWSLLFSLSPSPVVHRAGSNFSSITLKCTFIFATFWLHGQPLAGLAWQFFPSGWCLLPHLILSQGSHMAGG